MQFFSEHQQRLRLSKGLLLPIEIAPELLDLLQRTRRRTLRLRAQPRQRFRAERFEVALVKTFAPQKLAKVSLIQLRRCNDDTELVGGIPRPLRGDGCRGLVLGLLAHARHLRVSQPLRQRRLSDPGTLRQGVRRHRLRAQHLRHHLVAKLLRIHSHRTSSERPSLRISKCCNFPDTWGTELLAICLRESTSVSGIRQLVRRRKFRNPSCLGIPRRSDEASSLRPSGPIFQGQVTSADILNEQTREPIKATSSLA